MQTNRNCMKFWGSLQLSVSCIPSPRHLHLEMCIGLVFVIKFSPALKGIVTVHAHSQRNAAFHCPGELHIWPPTPAHLKVKTAHSSFLSSSTKSQSLCTPLPPTLNINYSDLFGDHILQYEGCTFLDTKNIQSSGKNLPSSISILYIWYVIAQSQDISFIHKFQNEHVEGRLNQHHNTPKIPSSAAILWLWLGSQPFIIHPLVVQIVLEQRAASFSWVC